MQISFNLLKLRDLCDCCCFQLQTGPKSKTYLLVYIIHRNNWIKHTTLKTCWSSHIICLINVLRLFLQVECNTKLDPTKATLLKVRAPLIPSVVAFTPHLLSPILIQIITTLMKTHLLIRFHWLSIYLVIY